MAYLLGAPADGMAQFQRHFGTPFDNAFSKVIRDGADYYVLGQDQPAAGSVRRATVTRLNAEGLHQWTLSLTLASVWNDAVLTPTGELMVVGSTLPFDPTSRGLMGRVSRGGSFAWLRSYDEPGREAFLRIIRHPAPENSTFPYYVVGAQNQPGGTATTEDVTLLNLNAEGTIQWKKIYESSADDEFFRDLEALPNGNLLLAGNGAAGLIYLTDAAGNALNGVQISQRLFTDVAPAGMGTIYAAANGLGGGAPHVLKFDQDLLLQWDVSIPKLTSISQVWAGLPGEIFVTGTGVFGGRSRTVIVKLRDDGPTLVWVKYLTAGSGFSGGTASYLAPDQLAFADGRVLPGGFGGLCAFISVSDRNLLTCQVAGDDAQLATADPLPEGPLLPAIIFRDIPRGVNIMETVSLNWQQGEVCRNSTNQNHCGWTAATCFAPAPNAPVGVIYDTRFNASAPIGNDWAAVPDIHPPAWTKAGIGNVFGIAMDGLGGDIYLAATDIYNYDAIVYSLPPSAFPSGSGPGGTAGVYKTNIGNPGVTNTIVSTVNAPSLTAYNTGNQLPNTGGAGNGIGNIAFDAKHNQLFLTNLEDGRIYRVTPSGNLLSAFDPFTLDNGTSGFQPLPAERIWGVGVFTDAGGTTRVYFARETSTTNPKQIWSIALTGTGEFASTVVGTGLFAGGEVLEISPVAGNEKKITDIAFAANGRMLLAERGHPHTAGVYEYQQSGPWSLTTTNFFVGIGNGKNSAGGVDYGYKEQNGDPTALCDALVWASGNCMPAQAIGGPGGCDIYGLEGIAASGNAIAPSNAATDLFIDFNHVYGSDQKWQVGDVETFRCGCPPAASVCDSISVTSTLSPQPTDSCCFVLTLNNQKPNFFTGIELCTSNGVSISAVGALNGYSIAGYTSQTLTLVPPGPPGSLAPVGNYDFIKFCLSNYQSVPNQQVLVKYYGPNETVVCVDTLRYNCTQKPKCLKITDTVTCAENGLYKMSFCIMSDALIGFNVNSIQLNPPPGITFTPNVFAVNNLQPGQMQCGFMTFISGAVDGQTFCYSVTAHQEDIVANPNINPTQCCTDTVMLACVTMPDCICDKVSASAQAVQLAGDDCCWKVTLTNNYSNNFFTGVQLDILTPGVVFGAINNPLGSGWASSSTPSQVVFTPKPPGSFIGASSMLPTFCLSGINQTAQVPQVVLLTWLGPNGATICRDTLFFDCPPPVNAPCAALVNWKIDCDPNTPGAYILTFQVQNNSAFGSNPGFTANQVVLNNLLPPGSITPNQFSIPPLAPGQTSGVLTASIIGLLPGQNVYFQLTLHEVSGGSELNCCTNSQQYCLPIPECPPGGCKCGAFTNIFVRPFQGAPSIPINCDDDPIFLPCPPPGQGFPFSGQFQCQGSNCPPTAPISWMLLGPGGGMVGSGTGIIANPNFNLTLPPSLFQQAGVYCLKLTGMCGNQECPCLLKFVLEEPCPQDSCCLSLDQFCQMIEDAVTVTVDNDACKATVNIGDLPDCDVLQWINWGDGQQTNAPPAGMSMHTYANSGTYIISWLALEFDNTGTICFEKVFRDTITVNCRCKCGLFDQIKLLNKKTGISQQLSCNNQSSVALTCPPPGKPYKITGKLNCMPASCKGSQLHWELRDNATNGVVASGNQPGPWFSITLDNNVLAGVNGLYNLVLTGLCGNDTCVCILRFDISGCPKPPVCPCDDQFYTQVSAGFHYNYDFNMGSCKLLFTPNQLTECDQVSWLIQGQNVNFSASGTTSANQPLVVVFPNNTIGSYKVTMTVIRPGTNCKLTLCQTVVINCLITGGVCGLNALDNGGFATDAVAGILGMGGGTAGWTRRAGSPEVVGGDGCVDPFAVRLVGKCLPIDVDVIDHPLPIRPQSGYNLSICYRATEEELLPGTQLVLRLSDSPQEGMTCTGNCWEIARLPITASSGDGWATIAAAFHQEGLGGDKFLTVHLENDLAYEDADARSTILLDNICLEQNDSSTVTALLQLKDGADIRLFPNPTTGTLTLQYRGASPQAGSLQLFDPWGRLVHAETPTHGQRDHLLNLRHLPAGIYFLRVMEKGALVWMGRFVKQ